MRKVRAEVCLMLRCLALALFLGVLASPTGAQELMAGERSCWSGVSDAAPWSLCFLSGGEVETSIYYPPMDMGDGLMSMGEGLGTGGRYRVEGPSIHFETTKDWLSEAWPWSWTSVTCALDGDDTMIQLTGCRGSGETQQSPDRHDQPDMAFKRDRRSDDNPTP